MNDLKAWFQSKTIWGSLVAGVAIVAGYFGHPVDAATQGSIVDLITDLIGLGGVAVSIYGRLTARAVIA